MGVARLHLPGGVSRKRALGESDGHAGRYAQQAGQDGHPERELLTGPGPGHRQELRQRGGAGAQARRQGVPEMAMEPGLQRHRLAVRGCPPPGNLLRQGLQVVEGGGHGQIANAGGRHASATQLLRRGFDVLADDGVVAPRQSGTGAVYRERAWVHPPVTAHLHLLRWVRHRQVTDVPAVAQAGCQGDRLVHTEARRARRQSRCGRHCSPAAQCPGAGGWHHSPLAGGEQRQHV